MTKEKIRVELQLQKINEGQLESIKQIDNQNNKPNKK